MEIILDIKKSIEENASIYFEKAKKIKKKLQGAKEAREKTRKYGIKEFDEEIFVV